MTQDELVVASLVVAFASLVTAHIALIAGLVSRAGPARALVAFVAFPLAPWWGARQGMRARAAIWLVCALAYAVLHALARR